MQFNVPKGESKVSHFVVTPQEPANGVVQTWKVVPYDNPDEQVDQFDIRFDPASCRQTRQTERMTLVFSIDPAANQDGGSWRFMPPGIMYCDGKSDYLDRIKVRLSDNDMMMTAMFKALGDGIEDFNFAFVAMRRDSTSGECKIYSSEDPGGTVGREN